MADRIVLTGGPGAGKTVISREMARRHPNAFVMVPEAATQVYETLGTRWDLLDDEGRRDVQRRIYRLQVEQEEQLARQHPRKVLLLDRGTVDGAAYWPGGADDYWKALGTTAESEHARYAAVIWMQSGAAVGCYDGEASNACRYEDAVGAIECGEAVRRLWEGHPKFVRVEAHRRFEEKLDAVERLLLARPYG